MEKVLFQKKTIKAKVPLRNVHFFFKKEVLFAYWNLAIVSRRNWVWSGLGPMLLMLCHSTTPLLDKSWFNKKASLYFS